MICCYEPRHWAVAILVAVAVRAAPAGDVPYAYERGKACLEKGDFEEAVALLDGVIDTRPNDKRPYRCRGFAWLLSGNPQAAIGDFTAVIEIDPKDAVGYYGRGSAHHLLGNKRQASADLDEAVRLNPRYLAAHAARTKLAGERAAKDPFGAFGEGVELLQAILSVGRAHMRGEMDWRGASDFGEGTSPSVEHVLVYRCWCLLYEEYRLFTGALSEPGRLPGKKPRAPKRARDSALLYATQGRLDKATAALGQVIQLDPKDSTAYKLRGALHVVKGSLEAAVEDFSTAISVDPVDTEAYEYRSAIYTEMGQIEKAISDVRQVERISVEEIEKRLKELEAFRREREWNRARCESRQERSTR